MLWINVDKRQHIMDDRYLFRSAAPLPHFDIRLRGPFYSISATPNYAQTMMNEWISTNNQFMLLQYTISFLPACCQARLCNKIQASGLAPHRSTICTVTCILYSYMLITNLTARRGSSIWRHWRVHTWSINFHSSILHLASLAASRLIYLGHHRLPPCLYTSHPHLNVQITRHVKRQYPGF